MKSEKTSRRGSRLTTAWETLKVSALVHVLYKGSADREYF
jgi:hypothetical protein